MAGVAHNANYCDRRNRYYKYVQYAVHRTAYESLGKGIVFIRPDTWSSDGVC